MAAISGASPVNVGFVLISATAYTDLPTKDPNVYYFVYDDAS